MLKKKNIAMVMAAATVATSVAPVFASTIETVNTDEATMIAKVNEMLSTKYTNSAESAGEGTIQTGEEYKNSVYKIFTSAGVRIKNESILRDEIEKAKVAGTDLTLEVTDKGHRTDEKGNIVSTEVTAYRSYDKDFKDMVNGSATEDSLSNKNLSTVDGATVTITKGNHTEIGEGKHTTDAKATIKLPNGKKIELLEGDYVLDLSKPIDSNGKIVTMADADADEDAALKVVGFELVKDDEASVKDIPAKRLSDIVITSNVVLEENLSDLLTEQGYTKKGAQLVNFLISARKANVLPEDGGTKVDANDGADYTTVVSNGVKYYVRALKVNADDQQLSNVTTEKEGYKLTIKLQVKKDAADITRGGNTAADSNVTIVINADSQANLVGLRTDIVNKDKVAVGNITVLAGEDRFKTAVAVSGSRYRTRTASESADLRTAKANAIILVGENAIVDGLAAGPLAAQKDAPILLTKKDEVPQDTMEEIKRVVNKGAKVYIIGGENTISKDVEAQLIKEINADIERLEGEDRFETSIAIAEEIGANISTKAYVVGGTGLADAMSVAALASKDQDARDGHQVAPIIVTPKDELGKDAVGYLKTSKITNVEVIGGESHISTDLLQQAKALKNKNNEKLTVSRTAGDNRNDTNAKVIDNNYEDNKVTNVYIAKDGDSQLVDALAAAPIVGRNNGVLVLATNDITTAQKDAIKNVTQVVTPNNNVLTQVGEGVANTLVQKIAGFLGL